MQDRSRPVVDRRQGGSAYPVFDAKRGSGGTGSSPTRTSRRLRGTRSATVDRPADGDARRHRPATCTRAACTPTCSSRATARRVRALPLEANYYEPAGAVSWDVVMTATPPDWRVGVQEGRRAQRLGDLRHAQGVVVRVDGDHAVAVARRRPPARRPVHDQRRRRGRAHPRPPARERQPRRRPLPACPTRATLLDGPVRGSGPSTIKDFVYGQGDLSAGQAPAPARRHAPGSALTFVNRDARPRRDLPHDHRVQGALQPHDRHRLPAGRRARRLRLGRARLRPARHRRRRRTATLEDAAEPQAGHLHVLLPRAPVHARLVQGQGRVATVRVIPAALRSDRFRAPFGAWPLRRSLGAWRAHVNGRAGSPAGTPGRSLPCTPRCRWRGSRCSSPRR